MNVKRCKPQQRIGVPCCRYRRNTPDSTTLLAPCIYNTRIISTYTDVVKVKKAVVCQILRHTAAFFRSHIRRGQAKMTLLNLKNYAHFTDTEAMDKATNEHVHRNWYKMNKTDRTVLDMIRRYSVKYGAAHLKHETIAKQVGKSISTIKSVIAKLIDLGILEKVKFIRRVLSGMGANIYSILPTKEDNCLAKTDGRGNSKTPYVPTVEPLKKEKESFNLYTKDPKQSLHDAYASQPSLYNRFKSILSNTINNTDVASKLFGIYKAKSIKLQRFEHLKNEQETFEELALQALRITTQATRNKRIKSIPGYYDGVLRELIDKVLFSDSFMMYDVAPDFKLCTH